MSGVDKVRCRLQGSLATTMPATESKLSVEEQLAVYRRRKKNEEEGKARREKVWGWLKWVMTMGTYSVTTNSQHQQEDTYVPPQQETPSREHRQYSQDDATTTTTEVQEFVQVWVVGVHVGVRVHNVQTKYDGVSTRILIWIVVLPSPSHVLVYSL